MWGFIILEIWNCKDTKDFGENQKSKDIDFYILQLSYKVG